MRNLRLNDPNTIPPKIFNDWQQRGYAYVDPGVPEPLGRIEASSWNELLVAIKKFRISNNLPIGLLFDDEINEWVASRVPQNFTMFQDGRPNIGIRRSDWPAWAKAVALLKNDTDVGVGTTVERVIGPIGGDKFKEYYKKLTGHPCSCGIRRDQLDAHYPYHVD